MADELTHFDETAGRGWSTSRTRPRPSAPRSPRAGCGWSRATLDLVLAGERRQGRRRAGAEIAGVMAAKKTADLIPLCHPLPLTSVEVSVEPDEALPGLAVTAEARTTGPTGVEMEALTAVSVACLTLYDMLKAADRAMTHRGDRAGREDRAAVRATGGAGE